MDFIDGHRRVKGIWTAAVGHPGLILPGIVQIPGDRGLFRGNLIEEGKRIGFVDLIVVESRNDMVFVERALFKLPQ